MFLLFFTLRHFQYEPSTPIRHRHFHLRSFPSADVKAAGDSLLTVLSLLLVKFLCDDNGEKYMIFAVIVENRAYIPGTRFRGKCSTQGKCAADRRSAERRIVEAPSSPHKRFPNPEAYFRGYPALSFQKENSPFIFRRLTETFP